MACFALEPPNQFEPLRLDRMQAEQKALEHRLDFATIELQPTEEYEAPLNPPAAALSTRLHNAFVAGYQNASETVLVLRITLFLEDYTPTLLIWLIILILPLVFLMDVAEEDLKGV